MSSTVLLPYADRAGREFGGHMAEVVAVEGSAPQRPDLTDPGLYLDGVPHDYFRWLRDHEPVAWHDETDGPGYWVFSRYDDVVDANRDWRRYSNALKGSSIEEARSDDELALRRLIFVNQDPPEHTRYRKLVSSAFTPGHVRRLTPLIEASCTQLVGELLDGGPHDFVHTAESLSFQMVATLFGVPEEDWPSLLDITRNLADFQDPEVNPGLAPRPDVQQAIFGYAADLIARVRAEPDAHTGVVADLVNAEIEEDGERHRLDDLQLAAFFPAVLVGGLSTTAHAMTEAVNSWIEDPSLFDQWTGETAHPRSSKSSCAGAARSWCSAGPPPRTTSATVGPFGPATRSCCPTPRRTGTIASSPSPTASMATAARTTTWPSVAAAHTSASVPSWLASTCGSCSASCSVPWITSSSPGTR